MACGANRRRDDHSSRTPVARRIKQPTRTADLGLIRDRSRAVPIRSCSRWGLPCRLRRRKRGALLPHRFTLAAAERYAPRRSLLCGTVPGACPACAKTIPAGRYPAPFVHGARTFLPGRLSALAGAAVRPTDVSRNGDRRCVRQGRRGDRLKKLVNALSREAPDAFRSGRAGSAAWRGRQPHRRAPGENDAGKL